MNPAQAAANYQLLVDLNGEERSRIRELVNSHFSDEVEPSLAVANSPPARGKEAIIATYMAFYELTDMMNHSVDSCFADGNVIAVFGKVVYTCKGVALDAVPYALRLEVDGSNKFKSTMAYVDASGVFVANGLHITAGDDGKVAVLPR